MTQFSPTDPQRDADFGSLGQVCRLGLATRGNTNLAAEDVLEESYEYLHTLDDEVAEEVYKRLKAALPQTPEPCFSNGDLYPDNMLVKDGELVAVIDLKL